jgi:hypothetical protein
MVKKKIIGAEIGTVGKVGHNIPFGSRNEAAWFGLVLFGLPVWGLVVPIYLDSVGNTWLAGDLQQMPTSSKPSLPGYTVTPISSTPG